MAKQQLNPNQQPNIKRQNNTTNTAPSGARIETGSGYVTGNGTYYNAKGVTFSTPFTDVPIVTIAAAGGTTSATGAYPSTTASFNDNQQALTYSQTTTGFQVAMTRAGGATWSTSQCMYFTWIAIGV